MSDEEQDAVLQLLALEEQAEALSHSVLSDLTTLKVAKIKIQSAIKIPKLKPTKILTGDQAEFICNKVNAREKIVSKNIQKEMISNPDVNSYKNEMLKESDKKRDPVPMEEWSILSDHVKYVMHDESDVFHKLNIDLMNYRQTEI